MATSHTELKNLKYCQKKIIHYQNFNCCENRSKAIFTLLLMLLYLSLNKHPGLYYASTRKWKKSGGTNQVYAKRNQRENILSVKSKSNG